MSKCPRELLEQEVACLSGVLKPLTCRLVQMDATAGNQGGGCWSHDVSNKNQEGGIGLEKDQATGRTLKVKH